MNAEKNAAIMVRAGIVIAGLASILFGLSLLNDTFGLMGNTLSRFAGNELSFDSILVFFSSLIGPLFLVIFGIVLLKRTELISHTKKAKIYSTHSPM